MFMGWLLRIGDELGQVWRERNNSERSFERVSPTAVT
jgi:hypothetical protein